MPRRSQRRHRRFYGLRTSLTQSAYGIVLTHQDCVHTKCISHEVSSAPLKLSTFSRSVYTSKVLTLLSDNLNDALIHQQIKHTTERNSTCHLNRVNKPLVLYSVISNRTSKLHSNEIERQGPRDPVGP